MERKSESSTFIAKRSDTSYYHRVAKIKAIKNQSHSVTGEDGILNRREKI